MISADDVETNTRFAKEMGCGFPVLSDTDKEAMKAYGASSPRFIGMANRWAFYIDKEGIIRHIEQKVSPRSAGEDLLKKLAELGFPKK